MIQEGLFYTKEHEWVKIEGDQIVFGITDHAQAEMGDITFIELPTKGKAVKQFDNIATLESVKAASDVYAPLSGTVAEVNDSLEASPEVINESPYEKGWICRIDASDLSEKGSLMDAEAYKAYIEETK